MNKLKEIQINSIADVRQIVRQILKMEDFGVEEQSLFSIKTVTSFGKKIEKIQTK